MPEQSLRILRYRRKITELSRLISDIQQASASSSFSFNPDRFKKAIEYFDLLSNSDFYAPIPEEAFDPSIIDQRFYDLYINAIVNLDACIKPDIDPNEGWIFCQSNTFDDNQNEEFVIDTQLMTLVLKPALSAGLVEWLFKPKKLNFLFSYTDKNIIPSFVMGIADPLNNITFFNSNLAILKITLHTPDQITLRSELTVSYQNQSLKLYSEYLVRAGIGAHRQNSTTGLIYNYWCEPESPLSNGYKLVLQLNPIMPSRQASATAAYLLHSVGAVNPEDTELSSAVAYLLKNYPQGLHGLRLVDTKDPYAMDIRSSQSFDCIEIMPLYDAISSAYLGSNIKLMLDLAETKREKQPNTIFISLI